MQKSLIQNGRKKKGKKCGVILGQKMNNELVPHLSALTNKLVDKKKKSSM